MVISGWKNVAPSSFGVQIRACTVARSKRLSATRSKAIWRWAMRCSRCCKPGKCFWSMTRVNDQADDAPGRPELDEAMLLRPRLQKDSRVIFRSAENVSS